MFLRSWPASGVQVQWHFNRNHVNFCELQTTRHDLLCLEFMLQFVNKKNIENSEYNCELEVLMLNIATFK